MANTGVVYFVFQSTLSFSRMWSPRHVTHLPPIWGLLLPLA